MARMVLCATFFAMAVISCAKSEMILPDTSADKLENFTMSVSSGATKTYIMPQDGGKYIAMWQADDKLQTYIDLVSTATDSKYVLTNNVGGRTATFLGSVGTTSGQHTVYGFYPADALVKGSDVYDGDCSLNVNIPARQNPTLTSFDPACDILIMQQKSVSFVKSKTVEISDARFARAMAIVKIVPKDATTGSQLAADRVGSVKMTSPIENRNLSGVATLDLSSGEMAGWAYETKDNSQVSGYYSADADFYINGENAAYLILGPGTLEKGETFDFEVNTDKHQLKKQVTLGSDIVLKAGLVTTLNVSFNDACVSAAGADLPLNEDFASASKGNNTSNEGQTDTWGGDEKFPTIDNVWQAGGAVRLGSKKYLGSITTTNLNLSTPFTVSLKAKGWTTTGGQIIVSCGSQSQTKSFSAMMSDNWETVTFDFDGETSSSVVTISSNNKYKRCFIDDVSITGIAEEEHTIVLSADQMTLASASGSTATFSVLANYDWTASTTEGSAGFTISPTSGNADELVEITVTSTKANAQTKTILLGGVKVSDGKVSQIASVFQAASSGPVSTGWAELPAPTTGTNLETCHHDRLPSDSKKRNYSFLFDKDKHCALWVAWPLHSCYFGDADRTNAFGYDPVFIDNQYEAQIGSYAYYPKGGSTFSHARGHQMPSAERTFSVDDNKTTFYATNMTPQIQSFNGGVWETLETKERKSYICSDTLYIVSGPYFDPDQTPTYAYDNRGVGKACQVPTHYWKIFLRTKSGNTGKNVKDCTAAELQCVGFWFEHAARSGSLKSSDLRSVSEIEALTGFTFFPNVPNAPKSSFSASDWGL